MEKIDTYNIDSNCSSDTDSQDYENQFLFDFIFDHHRQPGLLQNIDPQAKISPEKPLETGLKGKENKKTG